MKSAFGLGKSPKVEPKKGRKTLKEIEEELEHKGNRVDYDDEQQQPSMSLVSDAGSSAPWETVPSDGPTR